MKHQDFAPTYTPPEAYAQGEQALRRVQPRAALLGGKPPIPHAPATVMPANKNRVAALLMDAAAYMERKDETA